MTAKVFLFAALIFSSGLLFVNIYTSLVDVPNWMHDIPASIQAMRKYFAAANPGTFFRIFSPANQVLTLLALIFCWKYGWPLRLICFIALLIAIANDVFTFTFFYPRNDILMHASISDVDLFQKTLHQWMIVNWIRSGTVLLNVIAVLLALVAVFRHRLIP
jgi:hypothetical protein